MTGLTFPNNWTSRSDIERLHLRSFNLEFLGWVCRREKSISCSTTLPNFTSFTGVANANAKPILTLEAFTAFQTGDYSRDVSLDGHAASFPDLIQSAVTIVF